MFKSLKLKIVMYIGVLLIVVCTGLGIVSYINSSKALIATVQRTLPQVTDEAANIMEERLKAQLDIIDTLASGTTLKDMTRTWEDKKSALNAEIKRNSFIKMGIADLKGNLVNTNGTSSNINERDYFQKALKGDKVVSDPIISKSDGSFIVNFAVPIKDDSGKVISVLIASRDGNELSQMTNDITFGNSGKAFMISGNGTTIAHTNKDLVMKMDNTIENAKKDASLNALAEVYKIMISGKTDVEKYVENGSTMYLGFAPVHGTSWSLGIYVPEKDVLSELGSLQRLTLIFSILFLIIGLVL